jgi:hypothetical protein
MTWFTRTPTRPRPTDQKPAAQPARTIAEREAVRAAIATERTAFEAAIPRLQERARRLAQREAEAKALLSETTQLRAEADLALLQAGLEHDVRVSVLERQLRDGAPGHIDQFVSEVSTQEEVTRNLLDSREVPGPRDPATGHRPIRFASNGESVARRLAALRQAREQAEALRLAPVTEAEVLDRLTALRDGIPEVEAMALDLADQLSPGERRAIAWKAEDGLRNRWRADWAPR